MLKTININIKKVLSITLFFIVISYSAFAENFVGRTVSITDGDTIKVLHNGKEEKIRLNGIDCPERNQDFGAEATKFASALVYNETVTVEVEDIDKYGRTVGNVILEDGRSLNRELVKAGFAWWYRKYSNDQSLGDNEKEARAAKRGLWANPSPIPPWDFRRGRRDAEQTSSPKETHQPTSNSERLPLNGSQERERHIDLSDRLIPSINSIPATMKTGDNYSERLQVKPSGTTPPQY